MYILEEDQNRNYAGFWIRFVAYIIDSLVIYFLFIILLAIFTGDPFYQYRMEPMEFGREYWSMAFSNYILQIMYFSGLESSKRQATFGKMIMGIKVVSKSGGRLSPLNAIGRYLGKFLSAIILLIGFIMAAFDSRKQALHDKLAETFVVYEDRGRRSEEGI